MEEASHSLWRSANDRLVFWIGLFAAVFTGLAMTLFYVTPMRFAAIHYALAFTVGFLSYPGSFRSSALRRNSPNFIDVALAIISLFVFLYVLIDYDQIINREAIPNTNDKILTIALIIVILELTRRTTGWSIPIVAIVMIVYTLAGSYFPDFLSHRGYGLGRIASTELLGMSGVFGGSGITTIATIVFSFMVLSAVMTRAGGDDFLRNISISIAGRWRGGAAKISVISSALFGSVQGSSISNVVTTGSFTIPLMKRSGFSPTYSAAVEAAASSGGQILPPIMGASAFLLAEFIGVPYSTVALAAVIPALLYFVSVLAQVHFYSGANDIRAVTEISESLPRAWPVLVSGWPFLPPFVLLIWLISVRYPIAPSAFYTVLFMMVLTLVSRKIDFRSLLNAIATAFRDMVKISAAVACAGIVVGLLNLTGMGIKLGYLIVDASQGSMWLALIISMLITLVLGVGLPTIGAYVIGASVAGPALIEIGLDPLVAHLFILYYAAVSSITPPVAICAYTAAAIADAPPWRAGWLAFRLAFVAYVVPFAFVGSPSLLLQGDPLDTVWHTSTAVLGVLAIAAAVSAYSFASARWHERVLLALGGLFMFEPSPVGNWIGAVLVSGALVLQWVRIRGPAMIRPELSKQTKKTKRWKNTKQNQGGDQND